jgi:predicted extracellular nuclease
MRIASFNVDNLFDRAKAMNLGSWEKGAPILAAQAEVNTLFQEEVYTDAVKTRILELLETLGLQHRDDSELAVLRRITGQLLRRPRSGPVQVVASGRSDWIGWVDLQPAPVDELARKHTAMVMRDVNADVLGVVEAEDRPALKKFSDALLPAVDGVPYEHVMLIDGNDDRGIDVGILTRAGYSLGPIRTHVYDTDGEGGIFSRDCCEYHVATDSGHELVVLMNHFKSKGYSAPGDPQGVNRRHRQAARVADIYDGLRASGTKLIAVLGDLNDGPGSEALKPLLDGTGLRDISTHPEFKFGPRTGTFKDGDEKEKFDYVLLSPDLYDRATGGAVFRMGVWHGPKVKNPWPMYDTLKKEVQAASDHAAIYADIDL